VYDLVSLSRTVSVADGIATVRLPFDAGGPIGVEPGLGVPELGVVAGLPGAVGLSALPDGGEELDGLPDDGAGALGDAPPPPVLPPLGDDGE
jgi:hypothetical protein